MALDGGEVAPLLTLRDVGSNQRPVQHVVSHGRADRCGIHPRQTRDSATVGAAAFPCVCVAVRVTLAGLDADASSPRITAFEDRTHQGSLEEKMAHGVDTGVPAAIGATQLIGLTLRVIGTVLGAHPGVLRGRWGTGEEPHACGGR